MLRKARISRIASAILKLILTLLLFSVTQCAFLPEQTSNVDFDLSDNQQNVVKISLRGEASPDNSALLSDILQIVADDLTLSGRFKVNIEKANHVDSEKSEFLSHGKITAKDNAFLVDFELYLADQNQKLNSYQRIAQASQFREVAHRVSDNVFQSVLGVRGPFSTKICFVTVHGKLKNRVYGLWIADADGQNKVPLYSSAEPIMSPSWSPNGKKIAFIAFKKHDRQGLFIYDLAEKSVRELKLWDKGLVGAPAWSPNSAYLSYTYIEKGNADIHLLDLYADEELQLTHDKAIDTEAVWMPDSKSLIFTSDRAGTPQLYQINLDGSELARVTYNGRENAQASVSPMAKNIAMIHKINGRYHIALLNRFSKKLTVLTNGNEDESPSFSPGGSMIIYSSVNGQRSALNIVSSNGKIHKTLSKFDDVRQPSWSPLL